MNSIRCAARLLSVPTFLLALPASAEDFYVAPDGNDDNLGTLEDPFASVEQGQQAASAGDTVYIRGGVYSFTSNSDTVGVGFSKSGQANNRINYFAYEGELPVFDFSGLTPENRVTGLDVNCSNIHIRGLEVRGVRQIVVGDSWGVRIRGSGNIIERLDVHDNEAPGVFITSGADNLVLNCDSHDNYDPLENGGNADGFGCHSTGNNNVIRGCRGFRNSDDGYDFINAPGVCTVENSWAFDNGMDDGNGAGFKSGGFGSPPEIPPTGVPRHVIRFNVAFGNRSQGFYANHHPGGLDFFNNTAFGNSANFNMLVEGGTSTHNLRNNLALSPGGEISEFSGGSDEFNSWNLDVTVATDDFLSVMESEAEAPRQADGSLPAVNFMRLAEGSDLIDKGEDIGFPFNGSAPDLGAYEAGPPVVVGGAGGGGTGGAGGTSGGGAGAATGGTNLGGGAGQGTAGGGAASAMGGAQGAGAGGVATAGTATGGASGVAGTANAGGMGAAVGGSAGSSVVVGGSPSASGGTPTGGTTGASNGGTLAVAGSAGSAAVANAEGVAAEEASCGCRVPGRPVRGAGGVFAGLVALVALLRRRRVRG